jgi:hypothetical protein
MFSKPFLTEIANNFDFELFFSTEKSPYMYIPVSLTTKAKHIIYFVSGKSDYSPKLEIRFYDNLISSLSEQRNAFIHLYACLY